MSFRTKVALCVLMGMGVFTAGCAVAKAVTLRGIFADDFTFGLTKPATWAAVEQFFGIIVTLIPALRPLLSIFLEKSHSHSGIRKHIFWATKNGSSGFGKKGIQQQQQVPRSETGVPKSSKTKKTYTSCYRDSRGLPSSSSDIDQATAVYGEPLKGDTRAVDAEKEFLGDSFNNIGGRDYLEEWSLPEIADRRSAMISMPGFDV